MPFFGEFSRSSQDLGESDYDSIKSRDDRLNSSKSGMWIFGDPNTGDVLLGTEEMSCLEHRRCPAWNTRDVLLGTQEMSCLQHKKCPAWNTRDVLLGTHEMSCLEHKKCPAWNTRNVLLRTQGMSFFEHKECPASNTRNVLQRLASIDSSISTFKSEVL